MAEAVVSMALGTLRDLLEEEVRFLIGVSGEVKALEKQLKEMKCLLEDADRRKFESKTIVNWIFEIRDLAYRAEDAIETYAFKVGSTRRGGFLKQILRRFACALMEGHTTHQIGSEILKIKSELATVTKSMQDYGIRNIIQGESSTNPVNDENQRWKRMTSPFESEDCFVGKDEELNSLVSLVVEDKQQLLITIWGMGGSGKTTIARKVYNHDDVKHSFESFAWVCISQQCQIRSVLEDVLKQLNPTIHEQITTLSETGLIRELCQIQKNKRCIIVLDDLWELDHWDGLKHGFLVEGSRSKVMVTTRTKDVAAKGHMKEIGLLNDEDGWTLLKMKLLSDVVKERNMIEEIGKRMVKKCGNLPLAISLLGGVLSQKSSIQEWKSIEKNINASLQGESEIQGVLDLSYDELPHYLKPCFLYMGLLKEDESITGRDLYNMWIAQGMISYEDKGKDNILMDTAQLYLSQLVSRCLVQSKYSDVVYDEKYGGYFGLHDVVRELCLSKGKKEEFGLYSVDYQGGNIDNLWDESLSGVKVRHLAISFEKEIDLQHPRCMSLTGNIGKHVRSLLLINKTKLSTIEIPMMSVFDIQEFKLLKVLVFTKISFEGGKFPGTIGNLIHLRELRLLKCELDELPASVCNLRYLIILDLVRSQNVKMPSYLKKMSRLKYLHLPQFEMEKCRNNHISLEGLDELEILRKFDSRMCDFKSLLRMKNLRFLTADIYDNGSLSSIIDAVTHHWKSLHALKLEIRDGCQFTLEGNREWEEVKILKKVFTCPMLDFLCIHTRIGALLEECTAQMVSSSLATLVLVKCRIEKDPMKILGQIPSLKNLYMEDNSFMGENIICHASSFPKLKYLQINGLPSLKEWRVEQGAMPLLSTLRIGHCLKLMMIPEGFRFLKSLKGLIIEGMPKMGRRVSVSKDDETVEGEDYDKVRHVPSILILD